MDQRQTVKQMLMMNKLTFDNTYNAMNSTYEQNRMLLTSLLDQTDTIQPEGKKAIEDWLKTYKEGCVEIKQMLDQGYQVIEKYLSEDPK